MPRQISTLAISAQAAALALFLLVLGCAGTSDPQRVSDAGSISASGSDQVRLLAKNDVGSSTAVDYVGRDTHPSSSERIDSMKTVAAQLRSSGSTESTQTTMSADSRQLTRAETQPVSTSDVPASGSIRRNVWGITFSGEEAEQVRVVAIGAGVNTSLRVGDIVESCESSGSGTAFMVVSTLDDLQYCQPQTLAKKWSAVDSYRLRARRLGSFLIATVQL